MIDPRQPDDTGRIVGLLLDNKAGLEDFDKIDAAAVQCCMAGFHDLLASPPPGRMDYAYLKKIHRILFKDLWPWAGKDRQDLGLQGGLRKNGMANHFTASPDIKKEARRIFCQNSIDPLFCPISIEKFTGGMAWLWNRMNCLHPFIEGNGRSTRVFLTELARRSGIRFIADLVPHQGIIEASAEGMRGNLRPFALLVRAEAERHPENMAVFERNRRLLRRGIFDPQAAAPLSEDEIAVIRRR